MASNARKNFDETAQDVDRLLGVYRMAKMLWKDDPEDFPAGLDVLFRSAVVLLVSSWEAYIEDICSEALEHLVTHATDASSLPKSIKQQIASELKSSKNESDVWKIADGGWRELLRSRLASMKEGRDRGFNSPKSQQTSDFFKNSIGIDDIQRSWAIDLLEPKDASNKLDALVALRGEIAHRGRIKEELDIEFISSHLKFIKKLASKTDETVSSHLKKVTKKSLW
jgi:hypothetical protein